MPEREEDSLRGLGGASKKGDQPSPGDWPRTYA